MNDNDNNDTPQISRRGLLAKIGLAAGAAYVVPALIGVDTAEAAPRRRRRVSRPSRPSRPRRRAPQRRAPVQRRRKISRPSRPSRPRRR